MLASLVTTKLLVATAAAALPLSGVAAAAFTGALPDSVQNAAHTLIGAPKAHDQQDPTDQSGQNGEAPDPDTSDDPAKPTPTPTPTGSPTADSGPDATGSAAFGLCNAWEHGGLAANSTAYASLATAAGDGGIAAYCATIVHPGNGKGDDSGDPSNSDSPSPTGTSAKPGNGSKPSGTPSNQGNGADKSGTDKTNNGNSNADKTNNGKHS